MDDKDYLKEAKKLNKKSAQIPDSTTDSADYASYTSAVQQAQQLNAQSASTSGGTTVQPGSGTQTDYDVQEAKKLNDKSAKNKKSR